MPRAPFSNFRQADVLRAWAAARKDGKEVVETRIGSDGTIVLVHRSEPRPAVETSAYDAWKAKANGQG